MTWFKEDTFSRLPSWNAWAPAGDTILGGYGTFRRWRLAGVGTSWEWAYTLDFLPQPGFLCVDES